MEEKIPLEELKSFCENYDVPLPQTVQLGPGVKVLNGSKFIASPLAVIIAQEKNPAYRGFKTGLVKLKALLSAEEIPSADKEWPA